MKKIQKLMFLVTSFMLISGCSSDETPKTKITESNSTTIKYEIPDKPKDFDLHFIPEGE